MTKYRRIVVSAAIVMLAALALVLAYKGTDPTRNQQDPANVVVSDDSNTTSVGSLAPGDDVKEDPTHVSKQDEMDDGPDKVNSAGIASSASPRTGSKIDEVNRLRQKISSADRLPAESNLMSGESVELNKSRSLIRGDDFDNSLNEFSQQVHADSLATELTAAVRDEFLERLKPTITDGQSLDVACGMRLCMARFRSQSGNTDWKGFVDTWRADPTNPGGASISHIVADPGQGSQLRLIFTTDPTSNSFVVASPPPGGGG